MPILFSISVLAFVALLWASIAASRHIRRARRRKRRSLGVTAGNAQSRLGLHGFDPQLDADEVSFRETNPHQRAEVTKPQPIRIEEARPKVAVHEQEPPHLPTPAYVPKLTYAQGLPFVDVVEHTIVASETSERRLDIQPAAATPAAAWRFGMGLFTAARKRSEEAAEAATLDLHLSPEAETEKLRPAAMPAPAAPLITRAPRSVLNRSSAKMERPDWAYFNKDMGDLTDPYQSPRNRSRITLGESRH